MRCIFVEIVVHEEYRVNTHFFSSLTLQKRVSFGLLASCQSGNIENCVLICRIVESSFIDRYLIFQ